MSSLALACSCMTLTRLNRVTKSIGRIRCSTKLWHPMRNSYLTDFRRFVKEAEKRLVSPPNAAAIPPRIRG